MCIYMCGRLALVYSQARGGGEDLREQPSSKIKKTACFVNCNKNHAHGFVFLGQFFHLLKKSIIKFLVKCDLIDIISQVFY